MISDIPVTEERREPIQQSSDAVMQQRLERMRLAAERSISSSIDSMITSSRPLSSRGNPSSELNVFNSASASSASLLDLDLESPALDSEKSYKNREPTHANERDGRKDYVRKMISYNVNFTFTCIYCLEITAHSPQEEIWQYLPHRTYNILQMLFLHQ